MEWISEEITARAGRFVWACGRVLEQRRFRWLFGAGETAGGVLTALEAYGDGEGGYAFGLEPDVRGPAGQPVTIPVALKVLDEVGELRGETARRICDWLERHTAANGGVPAVLPSLRDYPRPPWLPVGDQPGPGELVATGQVVGPLLAAGVQHPWVDRAAEFCRGAVEEVAETHPYEVHSAVDFLDGLAAQGEDQRKWAEQQARRIGETVREQRIVLLDPEHPEAARITPGYAEGEYHLPYDYARRPESLARRWFSDEEIDRSLRYLVNLQEEDGGWPINWAQWSPTAAVEARPGVTLTALQTLRAYSAAAGRA